MGNRPAKCRGKSHFACTCRCLFSDYQQHAHSTTVTTNISPAYYQWVSTSTNLNHLGCNPCTNSWCQLARSTGQRAQGGVTNNGSSPFGNSSSSSPVNQLQRPTLPFNSGGGGASSNIVPAGQANGLIRAQPGRHINTSLARTPHSSHQSASQISSVTSLAAHGASLSASFVHIPTAKNATASMMTPAEVDFSPESFAPENLNLPERDAVLVSYLDGRMHQDPSPQEPTNFMPFSSSSPKLSPSGTDSIPNHQPYLDSTAPSSTNPHVNWQTLPYEHHYNGLPSPAMPTSPPATTNTLSGNQRVFGQPGCSPKPFKPVASPNGIIKYPTKENEVETVVSPSFANFF